jgi:hypothetical protein
MAIKLIPFLHNLSTAISISRVVYLLYESDCLRWLFLRFDCRRDIDTNNNSDRFVGV